LSHLQGLKNPSFAGLLPYNSENFKKKLSQLKIQWAKIQLFAPGPKDLSGIFKE